MPRRKKEQLPVIKVRTEKDFQTDLVAVTKDLAKEQLAVADIQNWSLIQRKIFALMLMNIDWKNKATSNIVQLQNKDIVNFLGWGNYKERLMGEQVRNEVSAMVKKSVVRLQDPYSKKWYCGPLIAKAYGDAQETNIVINPDFLNHFYQLYATKAFVTMISIDILNFKSQYSYNLYSLLRLYPGAVSNECEIVKTTKQLKELFGLGPKDYLKKNPESDDYCCQFGKMLDDDNHFDRHGFEKRVLNPAIEDINNSESVRILKWPDGKYYFKEKRKGRVKQYHFKYRVLSDDEVLKNRKQIK